MKAIKKTLKRGGIEDNNGDNKPQKIDLGKLFIEGRKRDLAEFQREIRVVCRVWASAYTFWTKPETSTPSATSDKSATIDLIRLPLTSEPT